MMTLSCLELDGGAKMRPFSATENVQMKSLDQKDLVVVAFSPSRHRHQRGNKISRLCRGPDVINTASWTIKTRRKAVSSVGKRARTRANDAFGIASIFASLSWMHSGILGRSWDHPRCHFIKTHGVGTKR